MVEKASGEAVPTCLAALEQRDTVVDADEILEHSAATANLLTIYRRRADHVDEIGLPTLGFRESVDRLAATGHDRMRLVLVTGASGYPWCVLFVAPHEADLVAILAVLGPVPST